MNCQNVSDDGKSNQWRYYNKAAMVHGVFEYFVRFNINLIIKFYFYVEYIYLYIYVISCTMFVRVIVSHDIISWFILLLVCLTFGAGVLRIITVSNTLKKMSSYSVYSARSIWGEHVTLTNYRISQTTSNIIINVLNELESLFNIWINNPISNYPYCNKCHSKIFTTQTWYDSTRLCNYADTKTGAFYADVA